MYSLQLDTSAVVAMGFACAIAFGLGWFFASTRYRGEISGLRESLDNSREALLDNLPQSIESSLNAITANALTRTSENFLELATERMHRQRLDSEASLAVRERAFDAMLDPIRDSLAATQRELHKLEQDRLSAGSALNQHLTDLVESQKLLAQETQGLAQALRRPEIRGRWGELTLRRLVELSGLSEHCDFSEQVRADLGDGALRPDMVVHLPNERLVVVDAKTPLDAYLAASEARTEAERESELDRHGRQLKSRIHDLANKNYWNAFDQSLDFVVLFLPGDQFLSAALARDASLLDLALGRKVILATPSSLIAILRALAASWRHQRLSENATIIAKSGDELLQKLDHTNGLVGQLGRKLESCTREFRLVQSNFNSDLLPMAKRLQQLGLTLPTTPTSRGTTERPSVAAVDKKPTTGPTAVENRATADIDWQSSARRGGQQDEELS